MQKLPYLRSPNMAFEFFGRHEERENKKGKGEERRSKKDLPWADQFYYSRRMRSVRDECSDERVNFDIAPPPVFSPAAPTSCRRAE
jgi:hypothetical protein